MAFDPSLNGMSATTEKTETVTRWAIGALFALITAIALTHAGNWDEYHFLRLVHEYLGDHPLKPMQTFHVHLFGWLAALPGTEFTQIVAGRLVMMAMLALTCLSIFRITRDMTDAPSARLATLAFLASGFVLGHGASFRADPLAAGLLMAALALMMTTRMRMPQIAVTALCCALALLVTIKAALFFPAFLAALLYRGQAEAALRRKLLACGLALALAAGLFVWHRAGLTIPDGGDAAGAAKGAFQKTLLSTELLPRRDTIALWAVMSLPLLAMALWGLLAPAQQRGVKFVALLMGAQIAILLVYRNAFPYFFPYIVPPLAGLVALGAQSLGPVARKILVAGMVLIATAQTALILQERPDAQRATLGEVHDLFSDPTATLSGSDLVASFPNAGFFMSTWGMESYRAAGEPRLAPAIREHAPKVVIADRWPLHDALTATEAQLTFLTTGLLPEDIAALRAAYVHYAGQIWVPGRDVIATGAAQEISLPIPGLYRLETSEPVTLDGTSLKTGDVIDVTDQPIVLIAQAGTKLRLISAVAKATPPVLPETPLYYAFWSR